METKIDTILALCEKGSGVVTAAQVSSAGLPRALLPYLVSKGSLLKMARGVYCLPDVWGDELALIQYRFRTGLFAEDSALWLADLSDRTPERPCLSFPAKHNVSTARASGVRCVRSPVGCHGLGVVNYLTPHGNVIRGYSPERTLCDILRPHAHADPQLVRDAFRRWAVRPGRDIPALLDFSRLLGVVEKVQSYLEVLP